MSWLLAAAGMALVIAGAVEALWTTLWVDGRAGPLTGRFAVAMDRLGWRRAWRGRHRLASLRAPVILVSSVLLWVALLWAGWVVVFSAQADSVRHTHTGAPADLMARIYFVGYTFFTLGNGDFSPGESGAWRIAAVATSFSGLFVVTLAVTYLLAVLEAIVRKRSFASQVMALGRSGEEVVCNAWDGRGFPSLDLQLVSVIEQLNVLTEQHQAYPVLHYDHTEQARRSSQRAVVVLDDALTMLAHGVRAEHRPARVALEPARRSVEEYLETLRGARIRPAEAPLPAPDLERVRGAGIATVNGDEFAAAIRGMDERRRLLRALLEEEGRDWPSAPD